MKASHMIQCIWSRLGNLNHIHVVVHPKLRHKLFLVMSIISFRGFHHHHSSPINQCITFLQLPKICMRKLFLLVDKKLFTESRYMHSRRSYSHMYVYAWWRHQVPKVIAPQGVIRFRREWYRWTRHIRFIYPRFNIEARKPNSKKLAYPPRVKA